MDLRAGDGTWWAQELPTEGEIADARAALLAQDNAVDCIVTHECSTIVRKFIGLEGERSNLMTHFFDEVVDKVQFRQWFFGCYHLDKATRRAIRHCSKRLSRWDSCTPTNLD